MAEGLRNPADYGLCPHGSPPGECRNPECLRERLKPEVEARIKWQVEGMVGELDGFAPGVDVGYAVKKRRGKAALERGQDMVIADKGTGLAGVADGLAGAGSGKDAGAEASAYAAAILPEAYDGVSGPLRVLAKEGRLEAKIDRLVRDQYQALSKEKRDVIALDAFVREWMGQPEEVRMEMLRLYFAAERLNGDLAGVLKDKGQGETTLVVGRTVEAGGKRYEVILNVGDSAAYKRGKDGRVEQVTGEDSAVGRCLELGLVSDQDLERPDALDKVAAAARRMYGNAGITEDQVLAIVTRTVGSKVFRARLVAVPVQSGDTIVFATDGLDKGFASSRDPLYRTDMRRLGAAARIGPSLARSAEELRDKAMANQVFTDDCGIMMKTYA